MRVLKRVSDASLRWGDSPQWAGEKIIFDSRLSKKSTRDFFLTSVTSHFTELDLEKIEKIEFPKCSNSNSNLVHSYSTRPREFEKHHLLKLGSREVPQIPLAGNENVDFSGADKVAWMTIYGANSILFRLGFVRRCRKSPRWDDSSKDKEVWSLRGGGDCGEALYTDPTRLCGQFDLHSISEKLT
jgi:hypothetical protein